MKVLLGILLFLFGILDIKNRKIAIRYLFLGIVFLCVCRIFFYPLTWISFLSGCLPGIFILLFSKLTKGAVGEADGCILLMSGIVCGLFDNLLLLFYAACLAAGVSLFLIGIKKADTKTEIPFIPFLFLGYLGVLL